MPLGCGNRERAERREKGKRGQRGGRGETEGRGEREGRGDRDNKQSILEVCLLVNILSYHESKVMETVSIFF